MAFNERGEAYHPFHVALAWPGEAILEQVVGLKPREQLAPHARAVAQYLRNRQPGVVVQDRKRHAAEE